MSKSRKGEMQNHFFPFDLVLKLLIPYSRSWQEEIHNFLFAISLALNLPNPYAQKLAGWNAQLLIYILSCFEIVNLFCPKAGIFWCKIGKIITIKYIVNNLNYILKTRSFLCFGYLFSQMEEAHSYCFQ